MRVRGRERSRGGENAILGGGGDGGVAKGGRGQECRGGRGGNTDIRQRGSAVGEREEGRQQKINMDGLRGSAGPTLGARWGPWQRTAKDTWNGVGEMSWGVQGWGGGKALRRGCQ